VIDVSVSENQELYRQVTQEAFGKGDLNVIDEVVSSDFQEHEPAPGIRSGRDGVKDIIGMMRTAFPDLSVRIDDTFGVGDQLCARATFMGTNTGSFMGNPPTGRSVAWEAIDVIRSRDGRITEHWGQMDIMGLLTQLGLAEMPMAA
jgi:predicted ester cyclase